MPELPSASWMSASTIFGRVLSNSAVASAWVRAVPTTRWPRLSTISSMSMAISGSSSMISTSVATWREISVLAWPISDCELAIGHIEDLGGLLVGEAFDGDQQEGLARPRRERREIGRGALFPGRAGVSCGTLMEIDMNSLANSR